jgi:hypothetical protein
MPRELFPGGPEVPTMEEMSAALDSGDDIDFQFNDRLGMELVLLRVTALLKKGYSLGDCTINVYNRLGATEDDD